MLLFASLQILDDLLDLNSSYLTGSPSVPYFRVTRKGVISLYHLLANKLHEYFISVVLQVAVTLICARSRSPTYITNLLRYVLFEVLRITFRGM